jgi:PPOX class probable FMN-dependent enzyme
MTISNILDTEDQLARLYDAPSERAILKQIDRLDMHCRVFIAASPFLMLATCGSRGADCSPRGGAPGFVHVVDDNLLVIPDSKGNNRLDSLRNIIHNPAVGMLFMVPGVNETLRVNGRACITQDAALLARFETTGFAAKTVIAVNVEEAFMQCAKALVRADIWNPSKHVERNSLPSLGVVLAAHTKGRVDPETYDREAAQRALELSSNPRV